jgi:hypothetical protein
VLPSVRVTAEPAAKNGISYCSVTTATALINALVNSPVIATTFSSVIKRLASATAVVGSLLWSATTISIFAPLRLGSPSPAANAIWKSGFGSLIKSTTMFAAHSTC